MYRKFIAVAKITDPTAVQSYCSSKGWTYRPGAILVHIPEKGFEGQHYIYCRYGMSVPYIRVEVDTKVWVEPTHVDKNFLERFVYTGFVDCGNSDNEPSTSDLFLMKFTVNNGDVTIDNSGSGGKIDFKNGSTQEIEMGTSSITMKQSSSSKIEIASSKVNICGSNLEVLA